jgi:hypothetical protein
VETKKGQTRGSFRKNMIFRTGSKELGQYFFGQLLQLAAKDSENTPVCAKAGIFE